MAFLSTASAVIRILDWGKDKYDNVKKWFKKYKRRRTARAIRRAIDSNDKSLIAKRLHDIIKKRQDRADSD